jgi:CubicO group peptidase (beta-lactamase class C family)
LVPLLLLALVSTPHLVVAQAMSWGELDAAAREAVASGAVPGVVVLVGEGDRVLYRKATGSRALLPALEPETMDTIFDLASLTKVLATAPAVLLLWEQGRIDLDAPLGRYLKEFNAPALQDVTVRRLLTHSAGLPAMPAREAMARGFPEAARDLARGGLAVTPAATFLYSDTGFILLGELVRRVSGEPLDRFVQKRFHDPLGMRHTAFRPPGVLAPAHRADGDHQQRTRAASGRRPRRQCAAPRRSGGPRGALLHGR